MTRHAAQGRTFGIVIRPLFLPGEKLFVGARWNSVEGVLAAGGPDIRNGGRFKGFMIEAVTAF